MHCFHRFLDASAFALKGKMKNVYFLFFFLESLLRHAAGNYKFRVGEERLL